MPFDSSRLTDIQSPTKHLPNFKTILIRSLEVKTITSTRVLFLTVTKL